MLCNVFVQCMLGVVVGEAGRERERTNCQCCTTEYIITPQITRSASFRPGPPFLGAKIDWPLGLLTPYDILLSLNMDEIPALRWLPLLFLAPRCTLGP